MEDDLALLPVPTQHRHAPAAGLLNRRRVQERTDLVTLAWDDRIHHLRADQVLGRTTDKFARARVDVNVAPGVIGDKDRGRYDLHEGSNDFVDGGTGRVGHGPTRDRHRLNLSPGRWRSPSPVRRRT